MHASPAVGVDPEFLTSRSFILHYKIIDIYTVP